jgi:hypothetical protein
MLMILLIRRENFHIQITSVLEDSRCPKSEPCFTQGNGKIELELIQGGGKPGSVSLNTSKGPSERIRPED